MSCLLRINADLQNPWVVILQGEDFSAIVGIPEVDIGSVHIYLEGYPICTEWREPSSHAARMRTCRLVAGDTISSGCILHVRCGGNTARGQRPPVAVHRAADVKRLAKGDADLHASVTLQGLRVQPERARPAHHARDPERAGHVDCVQPGLPHPVHAALGAAARPGVRAPRCAR